MPLLPRNITNLVLPGFSSAPSTGGPSVLDKGSAPPPPLEGSWQSRPTRRVNQGSTTEWSLVVAFRVLLHVSWVRFLLYCLMLQCCMASVFSAAASCLSIGPSCSQAFLWAFCRIVAGEGDYFISFDDIKEWSAQCPAWVALWYFSGFMTVIHQSMLTGMWFARLGRPNQKIDFSEWAVITESGITGQPSLSVRVGFPNPGDAMDQVQLRMKLSYRTFDQRTGKSGMRSVSLPLVMNEILRTDQGITNVTHELTTESPLVKCLSVDEDDCVLLCPTAEWVAANVVLRMYVSGIDTNTGLPVSGLRDYRGGSIVFGRFSDVYDIRKDEIIVDYAGMHRVHLYSDPWPAVTLQDPPGSPRLAMSLSLPRSSPHAGPAMPRLALDRPQGFAPAAPPAPGDVPTPPPRSPPAAPAPSPALGPAAPPAEAPPSAPSPPPCPSAGAANPADPPPRPPPERPEAAGPAGAPLAPLPAARSASPEEPAGARGAAGPAGAAESLAPGAAESLEGLRARSERVARALQAVEAEEERLQGIREDWLRQEMGELRSRQQVLLRRRRTADVLSPQRPVRRAPLHSPPPGNRRGPLPSPSP
eukprot:TRINITY_DN47532_c0_g1_i1.p1 TRINITY_DN47532_c0_g1~~TRINITY_DN47532_c0_g1_i1.p1  ORF type:complete len:614 (+),score=144.87 TRINITY_DN47532_c0_g1_i1:84-1844(+)